MNTNQFLDMVLPIGTPLFEVKNNKLWNAKTKRYVGIIPNRLGYGQVAFYNRHNKVVNIAAHRLIYYLTKGDIPSDLVVDHKNNDRMDNRPSNLRLLTRSENGQLGKNPKGYKYDKRAKKYPYEAKRGYNHKKYYLGSYGTPCGAYMQYATFFVNNPEVI
jgi:hypothetical protein